MREVFASGRFEKEPTVATSPFSDSPGLSIVIPVFNGSQTITSVVERTWNAFPEGCIEIVLVNDGSRDNTEFVCSELATRFSGKVVFVQLSRNFGEHNAVMAGLRVAQGCYVAVLDDDGQNPPEELPRMKDLLVEESLDVVYGRYVERKHSLRRRLGSWFNDRMATLMLGKPPELYLSSFKVMSRFVVDQIIQYTGPFPYIDGLIWRSTSRVDQIDVRHEQRLEGESNYNQRRLVRLWLNMVLGFSIMPLRISVIIGLVVSGLSVLSLVGIVADKIWFNPDVTVGIPTVLASIVFFSGVQLVVLGTIGEYVGRVFLDGTGMPQSIVRYVEKGGPRRG